MVLLKNLAVLGAGSAGLLAALSVKKMLPDVAVRVIRSPEIGVIGVGESTTPNVPTFLFDFLGISRRQFYQMAEPTWKLGIHFLWGPRGKFDYSFAAALDLRLPDLPRPNGYYCDQDFSDMNLSGALMAQGKAFTRQSKVAAPEIDTAHAFHLENAKLVKTLEMIAIQRGIDFIDGTLSGVVRGQEGISELVLEDGRHIAADFFIDASGFRSELLGKALEEPFISFDKSLFNDRALLGSWERGEEPILPYTTAQTMNAGWSWRIDHEHVINRGYVYCSSHISDEEARNEFAEKNPRAKISDRIVRFRSGRYRHPWVGNVMAIGNSFGFVEPLEATALMMICAQCVAFTEFIKYVGPTESMRNMFNDVVPQAWDEIRDFLTLHYKLDNEIQTPYWKRCREEADASSLKELLKFYYENGPTGFNRYNIKAVASQFGIEGYLVMLVGNKAPYRNRHTPTDYERHRIAQWRVNNRQAAALGYTVEQSLAFIRHPNWRWFAEPA